MLKHDIINKFNIILELRGYVCFCAKDRLYYFSRGIRNSFIPSYPQTRCKPAVCFGGTYRLIDIPLSHCLHTKLDSIFVITQYLASSLQQHIYKTYPFDQFHKNNIQLLSPEETPTRKVWFKGTADSIRQNLEYFESSPAEDFLILSGDQLYNMDFNKLFAFAEQRHADFIIAALSVEEQDAWVCSTFLLKSKF